MTRPENDFAFTPPLYLLPFLALTHIIIFKKKKKKTKKKTNKAKNYVENREMCDAINSFEATHKAYCFHLECIHRGECKLNLVNFHLWAFTVS